MNVYRNATEGSFLAAIVMLASGNLVPVAGLLLIHAVFALGWFDVRHRLSD